MKDYYASRAAEYDAIYLKPERQASLRTMEAWIAPRFAGARLLEVACGTGYWTQFIAPACASVLALDAAPQTMEIAASRVPPGKVRFEVGDAWALPSGDFDACFAGFWFSHIPRARWREFVDGVQRALAPGSRVVLIDNLYVAGSSTPLSGTDAQGDSWQTRRLQDGSEHQVLKNFPTEPELRDLLAGRAAEVSYLQWTYYWGLEYRTPAATGKPH